jgi:hypothetical protein
MVNINRSTSRKVPEEFNHQQHLCQNANCHYVYLNYEDNLIFIKVTIYFSQQHKQKQTSADNQFCHVSYINTEIMPRPNTGNLVF